MTLKEALDSPVGSWWHHDMHKNADGTLLRARINGACKTWKTRPGEFRLPMKHGLRNHFYIDHTSAHHWSRGEGR